MKFRSTASHCCLSAETRHFVVCSEVLGEKQSPTIELLRLWFLVAVTRSASCYAKHDFAKNKEVGLSEIVPPQAD